MAMALEGIRIVDWTIFQQGPVGTMMLADLGAEVIHVEERVGGDPGRGVMQIAWTMLGMQSNRNFYFEANNRNKKSLTVDLKKEKGREIIYRLVEKSDVFVQNFRKGVADRLGLGYQTLSRYNPKLIYASVTGYGPFGPDAAEPSFDYMGMARSGIMTAVGDPGSPPQYIFGGIADQMGAIMQAQGVLAALLARERLGIGQEVNTSHLGSMIALQGLNLSAQLIVGSEFKKVPRNKAPSHLWNHYQCGDSKWICLGMAQADRYWSDFCKALGIAELEKDPRFATMEKRAQHCEEFIAILDRVFASKPRDEWMKILKKGGDFIYTVVNSISDLPSDPQVLANDYVVDFDHPTMGPIKVVGQPVTFSKTPGSVRAPAPEFGEHTEQILIDLLGYTWEDIAQLKEEEVI